MADVAHWPQPHGRQVAVVQVKTLAFIVSPIETDGRVAELRRELDLLRASNLSMKREMKEMTNRLRTLGIANFRLRFGTDAQKP